MFGLESLFGGGGSSFSSGGIGNSKSDSQSQQTDLGVSGGADSLVAPTLITGSGNTITMSDAGAVGGALKLALQGIEGAQGLASQAQASVGGLLTGALGSAADQNKQFATALENVKTADVRVLIIAALAGVALVAVFALKGSRA